MTFSSKKLNSWKIINVKRNTHKAINDLLKPLESSFGCVDTRERETVILEQDKECPPFTNDATEYFMNAFYDYANKVCFIISLNTLVVTVDNCFLQMGKNVRKLWFKGILLGNHYFIRWSNSFYQMLLLKIPPDNLKFGRKHIGNFSIPKSTNWSDETEKETEELNNDAGLGDPEKLNWDISKMPSEPVKRLQKQVFLV